jgi:hypothetical protein
VLLPLGREAAVPGDALRERGCLEDDELALPDLDRRARAADEALPRGCLRAQRALTPKPTTRRVAAATMIAAGATVRASEALRVRIQSKITR